MSYFGLNEVEINIFLALINFVAAQGAQERKKEGRERRRERERRRKEERRAEKARRKEWSTSAFPHQRHSDGRKKRCS